MPKAAPKTLAERTVASLRKHFKDEDVALLMKEGGYSRVSTVSPTGIEVLDRHVIGIGGLPYGRIIEIKGPESAGKTTLLSKIMGAAQKDGALVAFRDAEHAFDPAWGTLQGVNVDDLVLLQGVTLEDFHEQSLHLLRTVPKGPLVIALDSIANLVTVEEMKEGKSLPGEHARLWPPFLRAATELLARRQALMILVNQMRMKIGVMYGNPDTTFAGNALKHAYTIRLHVSHGKGITDSGVKTARYMHVVADKNKVSPPWRKATLMLDYQTGFNDDWATLEHAKEMGCIAKDSSFIPKHVAEARTNLGWV